MFPLESEELPEYEFLSTVTGEQGRFSHQLAEAAVLCSLPSAAAGWRVLQMPPAGSDHHFVSNTSA